MRADGSCRGWVTGVAFTGAAGIEPLVHLHDQLGAGDRQTPEEVQRELLVARLRKNENSNAVMTLSD